MKYITTYIIILLFSVTLFAQDAATSDPFDLGDVPAGFYKCGLWHVRLDEPLEKTGKVRAIRFGWVTKCKQLAKDGKVLFHEWLPTKDNKREECYKAMDKFMDETAKKLADEYTLTGKCSRCPTVKEAKPITDIRCRDHAHSEVAGG